MTQQRKRKRARSYIRRGDLREHVERFWEKVIKGEGRNACWIWHAGSRHGTTPTFILRTDTVGRMIGVKITRVAWALAHGRIEGSQIVEQTCGDKRCVRHLALLPAWAITRAAVAGQSKPSWKRYQQNFMKFVKRQPNGCWFWQGAFSGSYGVFWLGRNEQAHRASYILFGRKVRSYFLSSHIVVRHFKCSNPMCVNPKHLKPGTQADNAQDTIRDGTVRRGSKNGMAILSETEVATIRARFVPLRGAQAHLAHEYGVTPQVIYTIVSGKTWPHVKAASGHSRLTETDIAKRTKVARGARHHNSKLTDDKVRAMRALSKAGIGAETIAAKFGLKEPQTYAILSRRAWAHVK